MKGVRQSSRIKTGTGKSEKRHLNLIQELAVRETFASKHRTRRLDEDGYPEEMGLVTYGGDNVVSLRGRAVGAMELVPGRRCDECGNYAVMRKHGCDFWMACG